MKIFLSGATGAMGHTIIDMVEGREDFQIVCGLSHEDGRGDYSFPVFKKFSDVDVEADCLIDFSSPALLGDLLNYCVEKGLPAVLCTTGYNEEELGEIKKASEKIPILQSGNMSLGVNLLEFLAQKSAQVLADFDVEIIEKHHNKKKDAPSGTALMLGQAVEKGRGEEMDFQYGRSGRDNKREKKDLAFHSVRGGNVVGEHSVLFLGEDEQVELKHTASSKKIFGNGALIAAKFLVDKDKGLYNMKDIFDL